MANVIINDAYLTDIADSIRNKNGTNNKYKPSEMSNAIDNINASEDLSVELTKQDDLLTEQETIIQKIINAFQEKLPENTVTTVEEIEQLLVSYFENKIVEEVEK